MKKNVVYKILKDYSAGLIDQYEAAEALDLDSVVQLNGLLAAYEIPPELTSDASAAQNDALLEFFSDGQ